MQTFKRDPNGFREVWKKTTLRLTVPLMLLALSFPWILSVIRGTPTSPDNSFMFVIIIFLGVLGLSLYRSMKRQRHLWETYEFIIDGDTIIRQQDNVPTITLNKDEILEISETPEGHILLKTAQKLNFSNVPSSIQDRERVISLLTEFGQIQKQPARNTVLFTIITSLAIIVLMVIFYSSANKTLMVITGSMLTIGLAWAFIEMQRSKHHEKRIKSSSCFIFVVLFSIVSRILMTLDIL